MYPKISIIVPVYKAEKYLNRCIDSILNQTFTDIECILVDDGSPDNSPAICDAYAAKDPRVIVIHQKNAGVSVARNIGLETATGEWIGFVDSDDWIDKETYEVTLNIAIENNVDIVQWGVNIIGNDNTMLKTCCFEHEFDMNKIEQDSNYAAVWNKLIKRDLILQNNLKFPTHISHGEDLVFVTKCFLIGSIKNIINKCFYNYYMNQDSACHQPSRKSMETYIEAVSICEEELLGKNLSTEILLIHKKSIKEYYFIIGDYRKFREIYTEIDKKMYNDASLKRKFLYCLVNLHMGLFVRIICKLYNFLFIR